MKVAAIIPAAGMGTRMGPPSGASRKQFLLLDGTPIIIHTLRKFAACRAVNRIYVALRPADQESFAAYLERERFKDRAGVVHHPRLVVVKAERADPRVEELHGLRARRDLCAEIADHGPREL